MDRRDVLAALGPGSAAGLAGCVGFATTSDSTNGPTRELTDGFGRTVAVPSTVERVVAVGPGALRQVAYLGATDRVVGVETEDESVRTAPYNLANPGLQELRSVGSAGPNAGGNAEQILAADPDLILYYGEPSRAKTLQSRTETPVLGLRIVPIADRPAQETMFATWELLGDVFDERSRAEAIVGFIEETVRDLDARTRDIPASDRKRAYAGAVNYKGAHGLLTTGPEFAPFRWTGVENVAGDVGTDADSVQVSTEQLLVWDPETIVLSGANLARAREDVGKNPEYESIAALATDETYTVLPRSSYHHNYGSILANAYFVGTRLYPDRFADVSLRSRTEAIFETLLGEPLFGRLTDEYDAFERVGLA